jgi:hypothetical protein
MVIKEVREVRNKIFDNGKIRIFEITSEKLAK